MREVRKTNYDFCYVLHYDEETGIATIQQRTLNRQEVEFFGPEIDVI